MSHFTITQNRKTWNNSAEWCKNRAQELAADPLNHGIYTIEGFARKLNFDFEYWALRNDKNMSGIAISTWNSKYLGINRPNSTEAPAVVVTFNPKGVIICGPAGSGKTYLSRTIAMKQLCEPNILYASHTSPKDWVDMPIFNDYKVVIIEECQPNYFAQFIDLIEKSKTLFIFTCQFNIEQEHYPEFMVINALNQVR